MKKILFLILILVLISPVMPVMAQEAGEETSAAQETGVKEDKVLEKLRNNNPYLEKLRKASTELIKDVPEDGVKPLFIIRESYSIIRSIYSVEEDVGNAVKLCGEDNPDMAESLSARFEEWQDYVMPVLKEQDKKLQAAIDKQAYKKPEEMREYLGLIDEAAEYADEMLDKRVVTTEEACQSLRESMDRTQENIVDLLNETPMPELDDDGMAVSQEDDDTDEDIDPEAGTDTESE